ncbi:hypothetical protein M758_4G213400 [Ceratodon purpureus]|nr:hypothetical protein M758_4G213400 [Ceratodon purpureus]
MRNHGWELPYHPLQTVAVAVFSGISFSFYVFFIPFVGNGVLKFHIYAIFSPVVLIVFFLYVRCAGCDPADMGVHRSKRAVRALQRAALEAKGLTQAGINTCFEHSHDGPKRNSASIEMGPKIESASGPSVFARWLCLPFACCKKDDSANLNSGEQLLYCSICEAEWLNNCVGKRNYKAFVSLMVACLLLLVIVWATGIGVLVRCFSEKTHFEKEIIHRLGSSFSRVAYIIVVVLLSLLAMLATIPLCQLFFFHLILIHKGITTYDYILAVREQAEPDHGEHAGDGVNSLTSSPASSNGTGVSAGFSSTGVPSLHRGVFCTPPRMFVEHHQKVLESRGDLESSGTKMRTNSAVEAAARQPQKKISVGINPWKLARMNPAEAAKAAAHARDMSNSRPIMHSKASSQVLTETEDSSLDLSSRDVSGEISAVGSRRFNRAYLTLSGKERWLLMKDRHGKNILPHNRPGILTADGSSQSTGHGLRCSPSRFSGGLGSYPGSSYPGSSYPGSQMASPDVFQESPNQTICTSLKTPLTTEEPVAAVKELLGNDKMFQGSESLKDGYDASAGESGDEKYSGRLQELIQTLKYKSTVASTSVVITPNEKVAVWENGPSQDNAKPRTSSCSRSLGSRGSRSSRGESTGGRTESSSGSRAEANILKHVRREWPQLRDRLFVSPAHASTNVSSPAHNNSPA